MSKLSSILLGTISGVAAAAFLTSKKGKEVIATVSSFVQEFQENPEEVREQVVRSAKDFSDQASQTIASVKEQVDNGDITAETVLEDVKTKSQEAVQVAQDVFASIKEKIQEQNLTSEDLVASIKKQAQDLTRNSSEETEEVAETEKQEIVIDFIETEKSEEK